MNKPLDTEAASKADSTSSAAGVLTSIEEQVDQLKAAGWIHVRGRLWKAPIGGYFMGPHGAWLAMTRRAATLAALTASTSDAISAAKAEGKGRKR